MEAFAKVSEIKAGDKVRLDAGFTCHEAGVVTIKADDGLYFECDEGHHYLSGQIEDDHYVGIYKA